MKFTSLLCLVGLISLPVWAQQNDRRRFESDVFSNADQIKEEVDEAYWQWGALFVSPSLGLDETGYDENVFSTELNTVDDYSAKPGLGFDAYLRISPRWIWKNRAGYNYAYYADVEDLRDSQLETETRLYGLFRRVYFDIGAAWEENRQRLNSEIDERIQTERFEASAKLTSSVSPRGNLSFQGKTYEIEVDDEDFQSDTLNNLEREVNEFQVAYHHRFSLAWWPYLELTASDFNFTQVSNPRDDSERLRALLGFRNQFDERLHYHFRVGLEDLEFPEAPTADSSEVYAEAFVRYQSDRQNTLEFGLHRYPLFSGTSDYLFFISTRLSIAWVWQTRGGWEMGPEISLGSNDYDNPIQQVSVVREDDIRVGRFRVGVPIRGGWRFDVALGYQERDVNLPGLDDEGVTAFFDLRYRPKRR